MLPKELGVTVLDFRELNANGEYGGELWDAYYAHPGTAHEACDCTTMFISGWGKPVVGIENHDTELIAHLHVITGLGTNAHPYRYHEIAEATLSVSEYGEVWADELYEDAIILVLEEVSND